MKTVTIATSPSSTLPPKPPSLLMLSCYRDEEARAYRFVRSFVVYQRKWKLLGHWIIHGELN